MENVTPAETLVTKAPVMKPALSDKTYVVLKWIAQIFMPALATLYFALASLWGLPKVNEVVGTITALDTFLGILLGISSSNYKKNGTDIDGDMLVDKTGETASYKLALNATPEELADKDTIKFQVKTTPSQ